MDKEFVPYEQALALKELGFDEPCFCYWGEINGGELELFHKKLFDTEARYVSAPLYQQVFRWFRENKGLYTTGADSIYDEGVRSYFYHQIYDEKDNIVFNYDDEFSSHEEAELACLKKLIELCKK